MDIATNIDAIMNKMSGLLNTKTVIGEPMQVGDVSLIPVMNVSFGFGSGGGEGRDKSNEQGSGSGGGGGARMTVSGVLVVKGSEVDFIATGRGGSLERILEAVPDLIAKVKAQKQTPDA